MHTMHAATFGNEYVRYPISSKADNFFRSLKAFEHLHQTPSHGSNIKKKAGSDIRQPESMIRLTFVEIHTQVANKLGTNSEGATRDTFFLQQDTFWVMKQFETYGKTNCPATSHKKNSMCTI